MSDTDTETEVLDEEEEKNNSSDELVEKNEDNLNSTTSED
jgi:hypothetical protein